MIGLVAALPAAEPAPLHTGIQTPWTIGAQNGTVGLFRPVTVGIGERFEVGTAGLVALIAPRVEGKGTIWSDGSTAFAATAELGMPTFGLRQLQTGFLQLVNAEQTIPITLVPGLGAIAGWRNDALVVSLGVEARAGIPLGESTLTPQDLEWFDPMITPLTEGWSAQAHLRVDWLPTSVWVVTAQARVELAGGPDLGGKIFVLRGLGSHMAVGAGFAGASERLSADVRPTPVFLLNAVPLVDLQFRW